MPWDLSLLIFLTGNNISAKIFIREHTSDATKESYKYLNINFEKIKEDF